MIEKPYRTVRTFWQFHYALPCMEPSKTELIYAETLEQAQGKLAARLPNAQILPGVESFSYDDLVLGSDSPQPPDELCPADLRESIADISQLPFAQLPGRNVKLFQAMNNSNR